MKRDQKRSKEKRRKNIQERMRWGNDHDTCTYQLGLGQDTTMTYQKNAINAVGCKDKYNTQKKLDSRAQGTKIPTEYNKFGRLLRTFLWWRSILGVLTDAGDRKMRCRRCDGKFRRSGDRRRRRRICRSRVGNRVRSISARNESSWRWWDEKAQRTQGFSKGRPGMRIGTMW